MAAAGLFLALVAIWLRVLWLQVFAHGDYAARADRLQEQRVLLRPVRGQLLDRHGRVLVRDLLSYSISAAPREMKDARRTARDLARILKLDARRLQKQFAQKPRFLWVARRVPAPLGQKVADLKARGVYLSPETQRVHTLGPAAMELLGFTNLDNDGADGAELQFDAILRGRPGWETRHKDGRGRSHAYPGGLRRSAQNGDHVVLTLDADLQSIVESRLSEAVDTLRAARGYALFMAPGTGEILAAVTVPHLPRGRARNSNFIDTFEPGSTFKVVTAGAVLEEGLARPEQTFEASATGTAQVVPGTSFRDVHKEARYTFADAVRWSSNIVIGRMGAMVGAERLYRYVTALGFGSITGVDFPGEVGGKLRSPDRWSLRSAPTIAIGHEISVTPLQLTLAYAAIANDGVLMRPMLLREVRDASGQVLRRQEPSASHRVFSPATCATLRDMLTAVVDSGTAKAARVPDLAVAGKTGTAQKYDAAVGGYGKGLYVSSFAGFAPAGAPSLVGVVVIDEPRGRHYYGGEVAAPVFRQILLDLRSLPRGPLQGPSRVVAPPPAPAPVTVPDLRLLPIRAVERELALLDLRPRFHGQGPRVLAQQPPAGVAVERGARIEAWLAAPEDSTGTTLPMLVGRTVREAVRELNRLQVTARVVGHGSVVRQEPPSGAPLPLTGQCVLYCERRPPTLSVGVAAAEAGEATLGRQDARDAAAAPGAAGGVSP